MGLGPKGQHKSIYETLQPGRLELWDSKYGEGIEKLSRGYNGLVMYATDNGEKMAARSEVIEKSEDILSLPCRFNTR
jgi:hypothetical protein